MPEIKSIHKKAFHPVLKMRNENTVKEWSKRDGPSMVKE